MKIIMYDGSVLTCSSIYFTEEGLIVDDYRIVPVIEVQKIEEE